VRRGRAFTRFALRALLLPWMVLLAVHVGRTEVYLSKQEALDWAFPGAERIEKEILYLSGTERRRIEELAHAEMDTGLFTVYRGYRDDRLLGYAFIDTRTIRSKPAVFLVVLHPDGALRDTRILAWQEPPEYLPSERWLEQFDGHGLDTRTQLGRGIHAMTGATLTSRSLTDGIRRVLAIREVKLQGEG